MTALSPKEAMIRFKKEFPQEIIECWNDELIANMRVNGASITSKCLYKNISKRIQDKMKMSSSEVIELGWLDLESIFIENGWKISREIPAYDENFDSSLTFKN